MTLHVPPGPFVLEKLCMAEKMPQTNISVSFGSDKMDELHHRTPSQLKGAYFYLTEWNSCSPSVLPYLIPSRLFCVGYRKGWKASKYLQYSINLPPPPFLHSPGASLVFSNNIGIFEVQWMMLATLKILTLLIFRHLDAMAAPKLVLKCSASQNYHHHFPSCISQLQSRNLSLTPLLCWHCASNPSPPAQQHRWGRQKRFSRFFQDFHRNKMQEIFFISFQKKPKCQSDCNAAAGKNHQEKMKSSITRWKKMKQIKHPKTLQTFPNQDP